MQFKPKTEKEINEENLLPVGEYDFEVLAAMDEKSKAGNDMIHLKLGVYDNNGNKRFVDDYLLESLAYKLRHFSEAVGLVARYESGQMTADECVGRSGRCKIGIEKDKTGQYADKNKVKDYVVPEAAPVAEKKDTKVIGAPGKPFPGEDDVPF